MPAGDWAQAGRVSSQRFNNAMTAVAINSVDPNKLIQESMKARSAQKQTAMKAKEALKRTEDRVDIFEAKNDARLQMQEAAVEGKNIRRKAGLLAAGASMIASSQMRPPERPFPKFEYDLSGYQSLIDTQAGEVERRRSELEKFNTDNPLKGASESASETLENTGAQATTPDPTSFTASTLTGGMTPLLETISFAEGTSGERGFTTRFGGSQFELGTDHPRVGAKTPWGTTSAAAGKFQIMPKTWDTVVQPNLNLPDFGRKSQIEAGRFLVQNRNVDPDSRITNIDDFRTTMDKLAPEWAGLPYSKRSPGGYGMGSSYYGQGGKKLEELFEFYQSQFNQ